jgi:hypothetical protein
MQEVASEFARGYKRLLGLVERMAPQVKWRPGAGNIEALRCALGTAGKVKCLTARKGAEKVALTPFNRLPLCESGWRPRTCLGDSQGHLGDSQGQEQHVKASRAELTVAQTIASRAAGSVDLGGTRGR